MSLTIALIDAANNCERDGAEAVLTLRSGREIRGQLEKNAAPAYAHVKTAGGGWSTVLVEEIAAVSSVRR